MRIFETGAVQFCERDDLTSRSRNTVKSILYIGSENDQIVGTPGSAAAFGCVRKGLGRGTASIGRDASQLSLSEEAEMSPVRRPEWI